MMNVCGVTLSSKGKIYYFNANDLLVKKNLTVVVETEKGLQFGKVVETDIKNVDVKVLENIKPIIRISTKQDYNNHLKNLNPYHLNNIL